MALTSERGLAMLDYLPQYYANSRVMAELLQVTGAELDSLRAAVLQILNEFYVDTASDRGLDRWEDELGLENGSALSITDRKERLKAKLRGDGTATLEKVENVADAFSYGETDVQDFHTDPTLPDYTISVEFISILGIPANLAEIQAAIRAVVPAHLAITYIYNYTTWDEIDTILAGAPRTWDQWDIADAGGPYTWDEMEAIA